MLDYPKLTIREIWDGCRKNNRASQKHFYDLFKGYAVNICYKYTSNQCDVEELVSDGFIRAFSKLHLFNEELYEVSEAAIKGWLKRIFINTCINWLKKKHLPANSSDMEQESIRMTDNAATPLDNIGYKEIIESIRELSPTYRVVFNLFAIEGMSHEEIAEQLNISVGTSRSNLFKAKENLRKILIKNGVITGYART